MSCVIIYYKPMDNHTFKCVISLGSRCYTSMILSQMKLKKFTGVFDWMQTNNPGMIVDILSTGMFSLNDMVFSTFNNQKITSHKRYNTIGRLLKTHMKNVFYLIMIYPTLKFLSPMLGDFIVCT